MISLKIMDSFVLNQQSNHGIMDEEKKGLDHDGAVSSSSEVSSSEDSDLFEEVNSSASSSTPTSPTSASASSSSDQLTSGDSGPLQDMSSLLQELPFKRGLSKHYNGKSQSFTSLANVRSLEDLAKPENPYNKKLKSCKSYGVFERHHGSPGHPTARSNHHSCTSSPRLMSKKASRGSCSSLCLKRNSSFIGNRPPLPPPHSSTSTSSFTSQTPLFALGV
ncbi:uncharacterized protein [Coffea arabica]|nr:uncharacterized protein LOC113700155 [Coffea arabica]